ncbi:MAG TPA: CHRD domain-containing protein [Micromonosporaceae bacterium]|nr:CHRD domain-containing protein [Micromonosporaceae bacterium]
MMAIVVLFSAAIPACSDDDDDGGTEPDTEFEATLSGSEEVPAVSTPASGNATVSIQGSAIVYRVEVANLENAVVSHIHVAPAGENGDVRLNLCGVPADSPDCSTETTGVLVEGSNGTTQGITFDSLVSAIRAGNAYVNVHTSDGTLEQGPGNFPGGEIRGQLTPQ